MGGGVHTILPEGGIRGVTTYPGTSWFRAIILLGTFKEGVGVTPTYFGKYGMFGL